MDLTYITAGGSGDGGDQYTGLDRFGRVVEQKWYNNTTATATDDFKYGYDRNSNVLWRTNEINHSFDELYHANGSANGYDNLNQLTAFARGTLNAGHDTISTSTHSINYTLLFENRQTLWFRVQELLRIARLAEPARVQQELDLYNRLLPRRDRLQAALLIDVSDETRLSEELAPWQTLRGEELQLRLDERAYPANLLTCRPEDRAIGAAHWVQFVLDADGRRILADHRRRAWFAIARPEYRHDSAPLGDDMRQSLLEDLEASDRD